MKKALLLCLTLLILLPALALGELEWKAEKNFITVPQLDGFKGYFRNAKNWTIVTRDNLDEHLALPLARGEKEAAVRERFHEDSLLFEAYADFLPKDVCIRLEVFEDDASREIWHLRHFSTQERKAYLEAVNEGGLLEKYETFQGEYKGSKQLTQHMECGFTTRPPYAYESGKMEIRYINGRCYVLTYAAYGRPASRTKLRKGSENGQFKNTPFNENAVITFDTKYLSPLTPFELAEPVPQQAAEGEMTLKGTVKKGAKVTALLDGEKVSVKTDKKGGFTLKIDLEHGDHELTLTTTHKDHSDRVETYHIAASDRLTPLNLTKYPEPLALAGDQQIAGQTAPEAQVTLTLDDQEPITLTADGEGKFDFTLRVMDDLAHFLTVTAQGEGQDENAAAVLFVTEYETFKAGLKAFEKGLTKESIANMAKAPDSFVGEKVKISVKVKELLYTDEGLGVLCTYNPPKGTKHEKTPLYLKLYSFAQDQIYEGMTMTVYGLVDGEETFLMKDGNESRLRILVQYGTYLT